MLVSQSTMRGSIAADTHSRINRSNQSRRVGRAACSDGEAYSPRGPGRGSVATSSSANFAVARAQAAARSKAARSPAAEMSLVAAYP